MKSLDCGHIIGPPPQTGGTGYGTDNDGRTHCYACIAELDRKHMVEHGNSRALPLYLYRKQLDENASASWEVTNWPGSLRFPVRHIKKGAHNIARTRVDVWFVGPDGCWWHGTLYGEWTQIVHCKRTKEVQDAPRWDAIIGRSS